jgi:fumarylacetoacetate (FAA) hydrolase
MKLATLRDGSRDGRLVLVSRDLRQAVVPPGGPTTVQALLDDWERHSGYLETIARELEAGRIAAAFPFDPNALLAPLPRAYQWLDASGYLNHVALVRRARGADMPEDLYRDPIMYQGVSDGFLAPLESIPVVSEEGWGTDFEAEVVAVLGDCPMDADRQTAMSAIRLIGLVNDVSLRGLIPDELRKGFGFVHGKPRSALSPVLVTPDELGDAWDGTKVSLPLVVHLNGTLFGSPNAGVDLDFDFAALIMHASKTRPLAAGTLLGSGTVSNVDPATGSCCIAERRVREIIEFGAATTLYLRFGDRVEIEMRDTSGGSIFGKIDQVVVPHRASQANP